MIDMHCHVLYGVDDGAECLEDSLAMLKEAQKMGYKGVVLTPHYMLCRNFTSSVHENMDRVAILKKALREADMDLDIYLGSELYYDYALVEKIGTGEFKTLGDSPYYLVETGREGGTSLGMQNFIQKLKFSGGKSILAHPERYDFIQDDPNILLDFISNGTLIQSNYLSLVGYYGSVAQKTLEIMLKHNMVQLLGSDAHQVEGYELYPEAKAAGLKLVGEDKWNELTSINPEKVVLGKGMVEAKPQFYKAPVTKAVIGKFF